MKFAARTSFGETTSAYGEALSSARSRGGLLDLTVSNPTRSGFVFPVERLLAPLADPSLLHYDADAFGMLAARRAVCDLYRERGIELSPERLLLAASTSEAYGYLLRLFCEPGDAILVPSPSYPLFDLLARLHDVELSPYPLVYHDGWQIDPASLAAAVTPRTRALVAIHPNNPTGHYCSPSDRKTLHAIARQHALPLIVDEVFLDYPIEGDGAPSFAAETVNDASPLTFVLGGLSKSLALPQMKLAWMLVRGPEGQVAAAMARLEFIADTFLSLSAPPQIALPAWLMERQRIQKQIRDRIRDNLSALDRLLEGSPVSRLRVEGGWTAVLRVPALEPDTSLAVRLLGEAAIAVHPGSLYGFAERGWLVVSLLPQVAEFAQGVERLLRFIQNDV